MCFGRLRSVTSYWHVRGVDSALSVSDVQFVSLLRCKLVMLTGAAGGVSIRGTMLLQYIVLN